MRLRRFAHLGGMFAVLLPCSSGICAEVEMSIVGLKVDLFTQM
jgi:hypothetical protein